MGSSLLLFILPKSLFLKYYTHMQNENVSVSIHPNTMRGICARLPLIFLYFNFHSLVNINSYSP